MTPPPSSLESERHSSGRDDCDRMPVPGQAKGIINPRHMSLGNWLVDIALAVAFEAIIGWPFIISNDLSLRLGFELVPTVILLTVALACRRWLPGPALVLGMIAVSLQPLFHAPPHGCDLGLCILIYSAAAFGSRSSQITAGLTSLITPALLVLYVFLMPLNVAGWSVINESTKHGPVVIVILGGFLWLALATVNVLFWSAGILRRTQLRSRHVQHQREIAELESLRAQEQLIVEQERNRIARDMHDVIAHSLAVVVAQADGGRYAVRANPAAAEPTLQTISEIAREALTDVRGLLAQLRHSQGEGPQAGLDDVATLLERMKGAGLPVEHRLRGDRKPIGQAAELAVYRLVQEALTNALRHGDPSRGARFTVSWTSEHLEVVIENFLNPSPPPPREGSGHGLIGMRERIGMIGGTVETGILGEQFVVRALVPVTTGHRSSGAIEGHTSSAVSSQAQTRSSDSLAMTRDHAPERSIEQ